MAVTQVRFVIVDEEMMDMIMAIEDATVSILYD